MLRFDVAAPAPDFALVDQDERPFDLVDLRGKLVLLAFIYTRCTDVCPLTTASMAMVQRQLTAAERGRVFFVAITTDPETDTPAVLKDYARRHRAGLDSWAFLTGEPEMVRAVWQTYGLTVGPGPSGTVRHPDWTLLIDPDGMARYRYQGGILDVDSVLANLRTLLTDPAD